MPLLAKDVMLRAAGFLNDVAQATFTNNVLLPRLQTAWDDLANSLVENGISAGEKTSDPITVAAGLKTPAALPADFFSPINIFERAPGEDDNQWVPVKERTFLPKRKPTRKPLAAPRRPACSCLRCHSRARS